jgi:hypothetical protein
MTQHHYPDHMQETEQRIVSKLLDTLLANGVHVRVFDGEEYATDFTEDRATIERETNATDVTVYELRLHRDGDNGAVNQYLGSITLIHGNDVDVISDYAWPKNAAEPEHGRAEIAALLKPAYTLAAEIEHARD